MQILKHILNYIINIKKKLKNKYLSFYFRQTYFISIFIFFKI